MNPLQRHDVELSVAWEAARAQLGEGLKDYEPDTLRIELRRRFGEPSDGLMAKLLAAQTVLRNQAWAHDYDVLFAIALACDGVPAAADALHHPTPEQLCWAMQELAALTGQVPDDDEGFDPDTVDPAIAVVLKDEGYVLAPHDLGFVQDVLDGLQPDHTTLRDAVAARWEKLRALPLDEARRAVAELDEDARGVQLRRLMDCRCYVAERLEKRSLQHVDVRQPG